MLTIDDRLAMWIEAARSPAKLERSKRCVHFNRSVYLIRYKCADDHHLDAQCRHGLVMNLLFLRKLDRVREELFTFRIRLHCPVTIRADDA